MCVDDINKKGEVIFSKECKRLLDLRDEVGTKGNKKQENRENKARLNHKYYQVQKEEGIIFNGMQAV